MLILLPPSEGKTAPARGRPVDLASLSRPDLTAARTRVLDTLAEVSARPDAPHLLGVGTSLADEVARNTALTRAHAAPAAQVYTGVLYAAAGLAELTGTARRRANTSIRIVSALWGVLSPADKIPAYRLSMGTSLPGIGPLARYWSNALGSDLTPNVVGTDVIIDCRSAAYVAAWKPPAGTAWLTVRVVAVNNGERTVVSHLAKHTRGVLTHHLLTRPGSPPRTIGAVVAAARELIGPVLREAHHLPATKGPDTLELVLA